MVEITWLGHGTFQFRLESGEVFLVDPWLEGNPSFPAGYTISRLDAILLTHGHFDHVASVLQLATKFTPKIIANYEIATWLEGKGVANCVGMNKGGTADLGFLKATMTNAIHSSSILDDGKLIYGGEPAGYILHLPDGRRAYFAGDTGPMPDMELIAGLYAPQLVFLPIGDHYTMGPREAAWACRAMRPKKVIPMHYGTFPVLAGRPEQLAEHLRDLPDVQVWVLEPGKPVSW